ncbi:hypothetical protein RIR_jg9886.t1 [Rhizophagus irregularis DAOM 181602=DAOM 197198]|nr:hypothetical protein RIR_jg9886.t1 [Rhizophagus irregularis DAOM 181602=DAOM 197198]
MVVSCQSSVILAAFRCLEAVSCTILKHTCLRHVSACCFPMFESGNILMKVKDDLYAILRSYAKKNVTIHIYTTAKLKQFIKDLEYREEARLNVTSKYTYSFKGSVRKLEAY